MLMRLLCAAFGHRIVVPTGDSCWEPIYCSRCGWRGP